MNIPAGELLVRLMRATVGSQEVPAGSNRGRFVERCQHATGNDPGAAWCACLVAMVGTTGFGSGWPVPRTGSVAQIVAWAKAEHLLVSGPPNVGDLFAVWHASLGRHAHIGVVADPSGFPTIGSISGNTTWPGQAGDTREGWCSAEKPWTLKVPDVLIRWTLKLPPELQ